MAQGSLTRAHNKIQEFSWELSFVQRSQKYPTDYHSDRSPKKDPLKQIMQSYFPMQEEKADRVYGAIDGALRANMFRQTQPRWLEWQKLFLSIIPFPEISAARAIHALSTVVHNPEIQNGLALREVMQKGDRR